MTHSFCFSLLYGPLLVFTSLFGSNWEACIIGMLGGLFSTLFGYMGYQKYYENKRGNPVSDNLENTIGLIISCILSYTECTRWQDSSRFVDGLNGLSSVAMSAFFVYRLIVPTLPLKPKSKQ
eukprot:236268_1